MKVLIVIPAFNEGRMIGRVLRGLPKKVLGRDIDVVVVNDGSFDDTADQVMRAGFKVLTHPVNRGQGAAIKTGMEWARLNNYGLMVTFDADGQHNPKDLERLLKPILEDKADFVVGSRIKSRQKMPWDRYLLNWLANFLTFAFFGIYSTDTQSGLRAFSKRALELIDYRGDRYDFSAEILYEVKRHNLRKIEVPASVIYTEYSLKKGQKNSNMFYMGFRILLKLAS